MPCTRSPRRRRRERRAGAALGGRRRRRAAGGTFAVSRPRAAGRLVCEQAFRPTFDALARAESRGRAAPSRRHPRRRRGGQPQPQPRREPRQRRPRPRHAAARRPAGHRRREGRRASTRVARQVARRAAGRRQLREGARPGGLARAAGGPAGRGRRLGQAARPALAPMPTASSPRRACSRPSTPIRAAAASPPSWPGRLSGPGRRPRRRLGLARGRGAAANPAIAELDLYEADALALDAARANVRDPRARFHWSDATRRPPRCGRMPRSSATTR